MIKDFTSQIRPVFQNTLGTDISGSISASHELLVSITFILYKPGTKKLMLVKAIKTISGLGLKEAKDIVDESSDHPIMFRQKLTLGQLNAFRDIMESTDAVFELNDREKIRNKKLIDLGICEKSDIINELVDMDIEKIFADGFSINKLKLVLEFVYSNITEEKLREFYDNYKLKL